jgi:hypothetical protein
MKYAYLLLMMLFVVSSLQIHSQNTFQNTISSPDDQVINCVTEDDNGNFILVGRNYPIGLDIACGYLIRINSAGDLLDEMVLDSSQGSSILFNVSFFNDSLYIIGSKYIDTINSRLLYLKLDKNLVKIDEKYLGMPSKNWFSYMKSIIDSDSDFVITGYTSRWDTVSTLNNDVFFYKLSLEGDSINSNFITSDNSLTLSFDIMENSDHTGYYAYGKKYSGISGRSGERFELSKQFDSLDIVIIPKDIHAYISSEWLNDSVIIITGNGEPPEVPSYSLSVLTTTPENEPIDYNHFKIEDPMRDHTALYRGVSFKEENIYVGGTSNLDYANPFFGTSDSWFHLVKVNPDLSPIWEYWYGGDAYYFLYSILATSDGGCLMVGNRYDYEVQEQERDIYVVKVNSDGLIVWTQEIDPGQAMFSIYPNPGKDLIQIKMPSGEFEFELFDLNGQILIRQQVSNQMNLINTSHLKAGIYFYRITDQRNQIISTGKWIKN